MVTREEIDEQYNQLLAQRDRLEVLSNQLAERMRQVRQALDALLGTVRDNDMLHAPPDVASSQHARQLRAMQNWACAPCWCVARVAKRAM